MTAAGRLAESGESNTLILPCPPGSDRFGLGVEMILPRKLHHHVPAAVSPLNMNHVDPSTIMPLPVTTV
jgi:hypothetical protein